MWAQIPEVQIEKWILNITIHWTDEDAFLMLKIIFNCEKIHCNFNISQYAFYLGIQWPYDF